MSDLSNVKSICVLTGAGISAESGLKTFRDQNGLWENHAIKDVASPAGFQRDPNLVYNFYNLRRQQLLSDEVKPNDGHYALAKLEQIFKGNFLLITQNVDNLHDRAGSKNILQMHGELTKMRCMTSDHVLDAPAELTGENSCSCCNEKSNLRPHIVWFGEQPFFMDQIEQALKNCDLFLSIGTSGQVYPAAMFVQIAKYHGNAHTKEFNLEQTEITNEFDESITGPASRTLSNFVEKFLSTQ